VDRLGPERWQIEGPRPWPADDFKVTDVFFPLTSSDAKAFHDDVTDPAAFGLDHPSVTVELTMKGRSDPLRFFFTQRGKTVYGMMAGGKTVYELDPSLIGKLSPNAVSLVSMRVVPYNAQHLTAVEWRRGGQTLELRRQGPGFTGSGLTDAEITDMFSSLNILDADTVEPMGTPPAGTPVFEIKTDGAQDAQFDVIFYRQPNGAWMAIDQALGLQYRLASNGLDGLPPKFKTFAGIGPVTRAAPAPKAPVPAK
jgi:Domain of unknown function (DUF4340)